MMSLIAEELETTVTIGDDNLMKMKLCTAVLIGLIQTNYVKNAN